jgi:hypothetical protein
MPTEQRLLFQNNANSELQAAEIAGSEKRRTKSLPDSAQGFGAPF